MPKYKAACSNCGSEYLSVMREVIVKSVLLGFDESKNSKIHDDVQTKKIQIEEYQCMNCDSILKYRELDLTKQG